MKIKKYMLENIECIMASLKYDRNTHRVIVDYRYLSFKSDEWVENLFSSFFGSGLTREQFIKSIEELIVLFTGDCNNDRVDINWKEISKKLHDGTLQIEN